MSSTTPGVDYSVNLKQAAEEIEYILKQRNIAGTIFLYERNMGEYLLALGTQESVLSMEGNMMRFRSKASDFGNNLELQKSHTEYTVAMIKIFMDMMEKTYSCYSQLYAQACKTMEVTHTEGRHVPHNNDWKVH